MTSSPEAPYSTMPEPPIEVGRLCVQPDQVRVWWDGAPVQLAKGPCRLLGALARHPDWLLTRDQLMDAMDLHSFDRSVDSHVKTARIALRAVDPDAGGVIETVYGMGYRLNPAACSAQ